jgi:hypothetical protein
MSEVRDEAYVAPLCEGCPPVGYPKGQFARGIRVPQVALQPRGTHEKAV